MATNTKRNVTFEKCNPKNGMCVKWWLKFSF